MTIAFIFWLLMLLALIGGWVVYPPSATTYRPFGYSFLIWVLLFLLGWQVFGWPIKG